MERFTNDFDSCVQQAVDEFTNHGTDTTVTETKINSYLAATDGKSPLDRVCRLNLLAMGCADYGWDAMSSVYKHITRTEPPEDQLPALIVWQSAGFQYLVSKRLTFEERYRVAIELQHVLDLALEVSPRNGGLASSYGELYLEHPLRMGDERSHLEKALEWFKKADEWSHEVPDQAHSALSLLAETHAHLHQWQDALTAYKRLRDLHLILADGETCADIDRHIKECEKNLRA
ncbi:MAG TPA: hypothetical protein V6C86_08645 [Oculatellaceae cyanobacterium]